MATSTSRSPSRSKMTASRTLIAAPVSGRRRLGDASATWCTRARSSPNGSARSTSPPQVRVAPQQVVDEFPAQRFLPADQFPARHGVSLGEGGHRGVDDVQHGLRRRAYHLAVGGPHQLRQLLPEAAGRGQVEPDRPPRGHALLGGAPAEHTHRVEFAAPRAAPGRRRVGEQPQVVAEQLHRHTTGVGAGGAGDRGEPGVVGVGAGGARPTDAPGHRGLLWQVDGERGRPRRWT
ncbi:hypothetical protein [Micromonospora sp. NPDC005173]|uniref:hypothetical protein n=1 Tax=Micromonospora sp. NPDC005173 TaxID=3157165 RepID=UPI0033BF13D2